MRVAVFLLVAVLACWVGDVQGRGHTDLIRTGPNLPWPRAKNWWPKFGCRAQSGGWTYEALPSDQWPPASSSQYYFGCKVWRPSWTSCSGICESTHNITSAEGRILQNTGCRCCKSEGTYRVRPYPRCWVVRVKNGIFLSGTFETVEQRIDYTYSMANRCDCRACAQDTPSVWNGGTVEEIREGDVTGRPEPPALSGAERAAYYSVAAKTNPGIRRAMSQH